MEEYEKLLDSLIADYKKEKRSDYRKGALEALYAAKQVLVILKRNSVQN